MEFLSAAYLYLPILRLRVVKIRAAFLLSACSLLPGSGCCQPEAALQRVISDYNVVGMAAVVIKNNTIVYKHSFGLKNIEKHIPLSDSDIFRIASISKSFSAVSIMQLAEAGKLRLDDDFSDLIGFRIRNPKFPDKVITLRMVMSHTSSINDSQGYFKLDVIDPTKNPASANCYSDNKPGTTFQYCNLNYNMIGAVIEKLSVERFDLRVKHEILDPLGLYGGYNVNELDSGLFTTLYDFDSVSGKYKPSPAAYAPRRAEIENYVAGNSTPVFSPTGGMKISALDLARYMKMHMNYGLADGVRIISRRSAKRMQRSVRAGYGLAIMIHKDLIEGKVMKGHTGSAYGLLSAMFFEPKEKFGIVVIVNGAKNIPGANGISQVLAKSIEALYTSVIQGR